MIYKRKAIVLFELIISIFILSVISIYSLKFTNTIYHQNIKNLTLNFLKLDLESTQLYIEENGINNIIFNQDNNKIYVNNNLLLDNVTSYSLSTIDNLNKIDICYKLKYETCQKWIFYR